MLRRAVLALIAPLLAFASASASQGPISFEAGHRVVRAGFNVELTVRGLNGCPGQLVELGWYAESGSDVIVAPAPVDEGGTAQVTLAPEEPGTLRAGVRGSCVPGEFVLSDVVLHVVDPRLPRQPGNEGVAFAWSKAGYPYSSIPVGEPVTLSVEGLEQCAGQEVELGFYAGSGVPDLFGPALVDGSGRASVTLVPTSPSVDLYPGAIANCLSGGFVLGAQSFVATVPPIEDGEPVTPQPPVVGTGRAGGGAFAWAAILVGAGLLVAGAGVFVLASRASRA